MKYKSPPVIVTRMLEHMLDPYVRCSALGDFEHRFHENAEKKGRILASFIYSSLIFSLIPSCIKNLFYWSYEMFKNYFKLGYRNIRKYKGASLINIVGLAVGLSLFILVALYVQFELSFDRFHTHRDRIFRMEQVLSHESSKEPAAGCPTALSEALENDFPDFTHISKVIPYNLLITTEDNQKIEENNVFAVDQSFLDMFTFPLIQGDPSTALTEPYSLVISTTLAKRIFGTKNALGQVVRVDNRSDFTITGVIEDVPANSHLGFHALISVSTYPALYGQDVFTRWGDNWVPLYVMLGPEQSLLETGSKLQYYLKNYQGERSENELYLRPLKRIHLFADVSFEFAVVGSINNIYIFSAISLFVLFIACINFMNLATARSADRAQEVGLRKVMGAHQSSLIKQFLGESVLTVVLSMILAILLAIILIPEFNRIVNRQLAINLIKNWPFSLGLLFITGGVGILAGFYPAIVLSSFRPVQVLRGKFSLSPGNVFFRKFLVVFQFSMSIALIIGTTIILQQNRYLMNKDLGYNRNQTLVVPLSGNRERVESFRRELLANPQILKAGLHDYMPHSSTNWCYISWQGAGPDDYMKINVNYVGENFLSTYEMTVLEGSDFTSNMRSWDENAVIINETAVKQIGLENPIGKRLLYNIDYRSRSVGGATVVGVVKDYHFLSLHQTIGPIMLRLYSDEATGRNLSLKLTGQDVPRTLAFIKNKFGEMFPEQGFQFRFLDEDIHAMYIEERKAGKVTLYLAILAILIACLGLFGLSSYMTKIRTKEIGIRKIVGASVTNITLHLTKDFMILVVLSNVLAWPAAYFAMSEWLKNFPYRTGIHWLVFVSSGFAAAFVAFVTVVYQSIWAAQTNPADSLRCE